MTQMTCERGVVRDLARRVAEIAHEPRMAAIEQRWRDVNARRRPDRAPVWCRPVGCWKELLPPESLVCADRGRRAWEQQFRQLLVKRDIGDDTPVEKRFTVAAVFRREPANTWGVDIRRTHSGQEGGAWAYDPPLRTEADFDRLRLPRFRYDAEQTARNLAQAHDLLGDILPVELVAGPPLGATLGNPAADLRGLEQLMLDMVLEPALVHRLMAYLRDAALQAMDDVEASGVLTPNHHGPMTCSDPIGGPGPDGAYSCANLWCMGNSQEFDQVSPAMWEEFCLQYQQPIFARCGLSGYGCCENLTHKLEGVLTIPNLSIVVCSAWTDLSRVIALAGDRCCIMWRQKASDVVLTDDEARLRADLETGARRLQGCSYQIVLRELQTLAGHPDRLHVWTRHAIAAAARFA